MFKNSVAILNIYSNKIVWTVGERSVNGAFSILAEAEVPSYTFYEGAFYSVKDLESDIASSFDALKLSGGIAEISTVYVGVPGEFSKTTSNSFKTSFGKIKTVALSDVVNLFTEGYSKDTVEYTLINRTPVYFVIDNYKTHNPIGKKASYLAGRISYLHASDYFLREIGNIMKALKIKNVKYISQDYADAKYLFSLEERDLCKILVNVGYTTTSISISCGNGLLYTSSIALGGGIITAHLQNEFGCEYEVAEKLKGKLNLGLKDRAGANYLVPDRISGGFVFSRQKANTVTKNLLNEFAEEIEKSVSACPLKVPADIEITFTGTDICEIKGAVEYLSIRLGAFPKTVAPKVPHFNKPQYTSRLALLDTALDVAKDKTFFL